MLLMVILTVVKVTVEGEKHAEINVMHTLNITISIRISLK